MKVSNYDEYVIFCVHNTVITRITDCRGNELQIATIVSMLNSCRNHCIDYHYCPSEDWIWNGSSEMSSKSEQEKIDWIDKITKNQG